MTGLVDEGKAVDIICLDFSKTFDAFSCKISMDKLVKYGMEKKRGSELKTG